MRSHSMDVERVYKNMGLFSGLEEAKGPLDGCWQDNRFRSLPQKARESPASKANPAVTNATIRTSALCLIHTKPS